MTELKYFKKPKQDGGMEPRVAQIKTDDIRPNRAQPRADFDQNAIIRLADSIRRYGILQPLTVRPSDPDDIYTYELIAGERRLRAAKNARISDSSVRNNGRNRANLGRARDNRKPFERGSEYV